MNFLGHAIFADVNAPDEISDNFLFGAVTADLYKRRRDSVLTLPKSIQNGIIAHTELDRFIEKFPPFVSFRRPLRVVVGPFNDPFIDILYDHLISKRWADLFNEPLELFGTQIETIVDARMDLLPTDRQDMARRMIDNHWLLRYGNGEGIIQALERTANRSKPTHRNKLLRSIGPIIATIPVIELKAQETILQIRQHCEEYNRETLGYEPGQRLAWRDRTNLSPEGRNPAYRK